jgi:hypothetical protein
VTSPDDVALPTDSTDLFDIVANMPNLQRANSRGLHRLYDDARAGDPFAQSLAEAYCLNCECLADCRRWCSGLTPGEQRGLGVVGGIAFVPTKPQHVVKRASVAA